MALSIAIRVDASASIGLGHVKRCLSLAYALREFGANVCFIFRNLGVDIEALVRLSGFVGIVLPRTEDVISAEDIVPNAQWAGASWDLDASQTIAVLREKGADWIIVDHYAFDSRWHNVVASSLSCKLAAIDDLADRAIEAEVLIDHNLADDHRVKYGGRIAENTTILGGPRFALLSPGFASAARYSFQKEVRSIGIFMGGGDSGNFSATALQACRRYGVGRPIEIVTTKINPHLPSLRAEAAEDGFTTIVTDLPDLSAFFARHDLQIGAGGGATWERCCIGAPTLALLVADNQRQVLMPLLKKQAVIAVESALPTVDDVASAIGALIENPALRRELSVRALGLVDGLGARRVAEQVVRA
jgi:UDP-2,4-diacetamido-2,4,6-trideoxy-beta-L-altropyranose hydrolase